MIRELPPSLIKRSTALVLSWVLLLLLAMPVLCQAEEIKPARTVRVAYFVTRNFQEGGSDEVVKSGYSYELLQKISDYTGWKYEYVYGNWADLYKKFEKGEIDLFAGLAYREEREPFMNWSKNTIDVDYHTLFIRKDDNSFPSYHALNGRRVGVVHNNNMTVELLQWAEEHGLTPDYVYYDNVSQLVDELEKGNVDAILSAENNIGRSRNVQSLVRYAATRSFIAVRKDARDILNELDAAMDKLVVENPQYYTELKNKYYNKTSTNAKLSKDEENWASAHKTLRVGYIDNYLPFSGTTRDGAITGIIKDIFESWYSELNLRDKLSCEFVPCQGHDEMLKALKNNQVDMAYPVVENAWSSEKDGIITSRELLDVPMVVVYKGEYSDKIFRRIAVAARHKVQNIYIKQYYPQSEILTVDTVEDDLRAVLKGSASCTIHPAISMASYFTKPEFAALHYMPLEHSITYGAGVAKGNTALLSLLNRGIGLMDKPSINAALYNYVENRRAFSLGDFVRENLTAVFMGLVVMLAIVTALISNHLKQIRRAKQAAEELASKEMTFREELQAALSENEAQLEEISSLNGQLQEDQAQLEELASAQEAQIEEITYLNKNLQEKQTRLEEAMAENEAQQEELGKALEAARVANEAKTRFLFNMSHDIRTPMNAVLGFTELLKKELYNPAKAANYLDKIQSSSEFLLSLINNVLDTARIDSGKATLDESFFDLIENGRDSLSIFDESCKKKNMQVNHHIDIKHRYVWLDSVKFREVFMNLFGNAVKYTPEGGMINLSLKELPQTREGYATYVTTISDNGIGMTQEFLENIFDPFTREYNTTECHALGTGLGMAIVKKYIELMGGTIEVESALGKGTTFTVTLRHRLVDNPEEYLQKNLSVEANGQQFKGKRILLAEDNELNAEIAIAILEDCGFEVEHAEDGVICVDKLLHAEANYYNVILMDIQMPNLNGYEATRSIRKLQDAAKANIPILAMTANAFDEDKRDALNAGMNGHVAKPIDISQLMSELGRVLR